MVVATVFSLAYVLRLFWRVFLEEPKQKTVTKLPTLMGASMLFLSLINVALGIWPGPIISLIGSAEIGRG